MKMIVKIGTMISILLFVLAVGYFALVRLDITGRSRDINLFSLVPSDCIGVLESGNVNAFLNECSNLNYSRELEGFQFPGLFSFIINELNDYTSETHGLSSEMSRLLVSFHRPGTSMDQVVYFRMGMTDEQLLSDILQEYMPGNFLPKEEVYRGKTMSVYPLYHDRYLVAYTEKEFVVLSFQKRLVERVIDAQLDESSVSRDAVFTNMINKKKTQSLLRLYGKSTLLPFLDSDMECWSEFDFHLNSDVLYLMGETYAPEASDYMAKVEECLKDIPVINEEGIIVSAQKDSTVFFMNQAFDMNDGGNRTLFNECVANLAEETVFSLVTDMRKVEENPRRFKTYLPPFILNNVSSFTPFVLSVQLSLTGESLTHMWVFTYKN